MIDDEHKLDFFVGIEEFYVDEKTLQELRASTLKSSFDETEFPPLWAEAIKRGIKVLVKNDTDKPSQFILDDNGMFTLVK